MLARGGKLGRSCHLGQREEEKGEGKVLGLRAENREGEFFFFLFPFSFKTNLFQNIFKTKFESLFNL